jgi:chromosome segregation ATPase
MHVSASLQARQQAGQLSGLQQQLSAAREEVTTKLADAARLEGELAAKTRALAAAEKQAAEGSGALAAAAGREQQLAARVAELEAAQGQVRERHLPVLAVDAAIPRLVHLPGAQPACCCGFLSAERALVI